MDPELKRRSLLFDVRPAQARPPLGVITLEVSEKLQSKHPKPHRLDNNELDQETAEHDHERTAAVLPAGALPAVFSPRPVRRHYVPTPTTTPKYFRWQRPPKSPLQSALPFLHNKPLAPSPVMPSPRAQRCQSSSKISVNVQASVLSGNGMGGNGVVSGDLVAIHELDVAPWKEENASVLELPVTPQSSHYLFDGPVSQATSSMPLTPLISSTQRYEHSPPFNSECSLSPVSTSLSVSTPPLSVAVAGSVPLRLQPLTPPSSAPETPDEQSDQESQSCPSPDSTDSSVLSTGDVARNLEIDSALVEFEPVDDTLATPIVIRNAGDSQPHVFTQHVLRGVILRKYLHVNNIARKLRETEQNALHVSQTGSERVEKTQLSTPFASTKAKPQEPSLERFNSSVSEDKSGSTTILRRLASVDQTINETEQRMRLVPNANVPVLTAQKLAKGKSLRSIGEDKQLLKEKLQRQRPIDILETDNALGAIPVRAKLDPTSVLRICRHVIAKRAIKSFLRQEMSVITQTEVFLRDDPALQRRPSLSINSRGSSDNRIPIKALAPDLVENLAVYLKEGDQHLTIDELFLKALLFEADKDLKRAILVASACVVIEQDFILAALLRARCCRRLGLWTQAIKDLSHVLILRPEDQRLFLLRACLNSKIGDTENALTDVNRALVLHPQYLDALLLRAEIHQRNQSVDAALQDLTAVLGLDKCCWRAYYDRATLRLRAIEGSLLYHPEHMQYEELVSVIIQDYINALHKGCTLIEVVETVGDLTVKLLEFTGDGTVLRQVIQNLTRLIHLLVLNPNRGFSTNFGTSQSLSILNLELLIAAIHTQRGRLYALSKDQLTALEDFDQALVLAYHYPIAHFYRGALASLIVPKESTGMETATNLQHLSRSLSFDPTIAGAFTVRGALHLRDLRFNNALQDFKAAVATDPTLSPIWLQIALIYLNHYHDSEECIKACSNALSTDAGLTKAIYLRAEAYTRLGNTLAAFRDYNRLTRVQPNDQMATLLRGRLQLQLQLTRPALYSLVTFSEILMQNAPTKPQIEMKDVLLLSGRAFQLLSRFQSAVNAFEQAAAETPTSENLVLLSESLHSLGDTANALKVSEKVVIADPFSFRGYARRGQLFAAQGKLSFAMIEYDQALVLAPKERRILYERGVVQMLLYLQWRAAFELSLNSPDRNFSRSAFAPRFTACEIDQQLGAEALKDDVLAQKMMKQYFVGSLTAFSTCLRLDPLFIDAYVARAELNALGEDYGRAFCDLETAITQQPTNVRAHVSLGVLKCQFAAYAAAIEDFDKALKLASFPVSEVRAYALFNRGVAYQKLKLWSQAESSYSQSIAIFGPGRDIGAHRNRAIVRCQLGTFQSALEDLEQVQTFAPNDDELHGVLGFALLQLHRYEDAAQYFAVYGRFGRNTYVDSGNTYLNMATKSEVHLDEKQYANDLQRARRFYVKAVRLQPLNVDIRLNLAHCLRKEKLLREAIAQCDVVALTQPLNHLCLENKAFTLFQLSNRQEEAIKSMDSAVSSCVTSSASLETRFYAFTRDKSHRNALKTLRIDDAKTSKTPKVHLTGSKEQMLALYLLNRGIMLEKMGLLTRARQDYMDALHFDPFSGHIHVCLGTLSLRQGNFAQSAMELQRAIDLDSSSGVAYLNFGCLCLCRNELSTAIAYFDTAIVLLPNCSYAYANKAVALARNGYISSAELDLKKAIEKLPSRTEFYLARGKISALQKRLHDAMVDFSTALFLGYDGKL